VEVESAVGNGSTFSFEVTLERVSGRKLTTSASMASMASMEGRTVLIVDDNATNRLILERMMSSWHMVPTSVVGADQALALLEQRWREGQQFAVALLDYHMPGLDGAQLARIMANDARYRQTRRVLLTSTGDRGNLADGEVDFDISKPIRQSALFDGLVRLFGDVDNSETDNSESATTAAQAEQSRPATSGRVLLAEDNPVNQVVAQRMLESLGYAVDIVQNGEDAVRQALRERYDAIFMDCQMPRMDGYEATVAIRGQEGGGRHVPVIALTASAMEGDADRCFTAGMDDYLSKPVRIDDLQQTLERWTHRQAVDITERRPTQENTQQ
jgi:two-component system sensor histidine kinase/response regulator